MTDRVLSKNILIYKYSGILMRVTWGCFGRLFLSFLSCKIFMRSNILILLNIYNLVYDLKFNLQCGMNYWNTLQTPLGWTELTCYSCLSFLGHHLSCQSGRYYWNGELSSILESSNKVLNKNNNVCEISKQLKKNYNDDLKSGYHS